MEGISLPDFRTYFLAIAIKTTVLMKGKIHSSVKHTSEHRNRPTQICPTGFYFNKDVKAI